MRPRTVDVALAEADELVMRYAGSSVPGNQPLTIRAGDLRRLVAHAWLEGAAAESARLLHEALDYEVGAVEEEVGG